MNHLCRLSPPPPHMHSHTRAPPLPPFFSSSFSRAPRARARLVEGKRQRVIWRGGEEKGGGGVKSGTESSEWGIKINLGVTIAAMITARNFHLKASAARPPRTAASAVCPHQYFTTILTFSSFVGVTAFTSPKL